MEVKIKDYQRKQFEADQEEHRKKWTDKATQEDWPNKDDVKVQVWVDNKGSIVDSISFRELKEDVYLKANKKPNADGGILEW